VHATELDEIHRHRRVAPGAEPEVRELDVLLSVDEVHAHTHRVRQIEPLLDRLAPPDRKAIVIVLEEAIALGLAECEIGVLSDSDVCGERDERTCESVWSHCFDSGGFFTADT
jgi:hypothetical protein